MHRKGINMRYLGKIVKVQNTLKVKNDSLLIPDLAGVINI